jgi:maltose alpha-D-glucosyltransferase/alpha-amylase
MTGRPWPDSATIPTPPSIASAGYPLVYRQGDQHLVVVNPAGTARSVELPALAVASVQPLEVSGVRLLDGHVEAGPFGYGVFLRGTGATTAGCAKV